MSAEETVRIPSISAKKIGYMIPISNALAIEYGLLPDPRSPEEQSAEREKWRAEAARRREEIVAAHADALASIDPALKPVLELHAPVFISDLGDSAECHGCDFGGYEGDHPYFPCRTYELITKT